MIAEDREDVSFIWFNEYDEESHLNDIDLKYLYRKKETFTKNFRKSISRGDIGLMK